MAAPALERQLENSRDVQSGEITPFQNHGVKTYLPVDPLRHAGVDLDDPGPWSWHYIRTRQLLIIDLSGDGLNDGVDDDLDIDNRP